MYLVVIGINLEKNVYRKARYKCEICGGQGTRYPVACHEIWIYEDNDLIQKLDGLIALCPNCHEVKHIGLAEKHGRLDSAKRHLTNVNNWTNYQTEEYLSLIKQIWLERSKFEWGLNLDWLGNQEVSIIDSFPKQ